MVTVVWDRGLDLDKRAVMEALRKRGIDSRPFFHPLSSIPAYEATAQAADARARNTVAYGIAPYGVNLPSALNLTRDQVAYVCEQVRTVVGQRQVRA